MADTAALQMFWGTGTAGYNDVINEVWLVEYDSNPTDYYNAEARAHTAGLPARRALYASSSLVDTYVTQVDGKQMSDERKRTWLWNVTYTTPPPVEFGIFATAAPLSRAASYDIRYIERERVLTRAKNVAELTHGDGKGGSRAADTLGPIVNAAGKRPDEPIVVTERRPVLVIRKNYSTLATIEGLNNTYFDTTNSDTVGVYPARSLKYLLTSSLGAMKENGTTYYPGETEIVVEGSTDLTIDNVGYEYWDAAGSDWKRVKDAEGNFMAEPINLKVDGDLGGDNTTTITYRHLSAVAYSSLFS